MSDTAIVLERAVMYDRIWGYDFDGDSRSLDVHVGYLRRKLEAAGLPRLIETVRGVSLVLRPGGAAGPAAGYSGGIRPLALQQ